MPSANNANSAFRPVRSSSPQYIGEYLHPRTLTCYDDDDDDEEERTPPPRPSSRPSSSPTPYNQHKWNNSSPKVFLPNSSTVSLPASAVLGLRGRSATPTAVQTANIEVGHKRSLSVGANQNFTSNPATRALENEYYQSHAKQPNSFEVLTACEEQLEERRRQVIQ